MTYKIDFISTKKLIHVENFSKKRVLWLYNKVQKEGVWKKPLIVDKDYFIVMDGQHRMEVAKILKLDYVPCIMLDYKKVKFYSLRKKYQFNLDEIIQKATNGNIFPYKTVKHVFDNQSDIKCNFTINELKNLKNV